VIVPVESSSAVGEMPNASAMVLSKDAFGPNSAVVNAVVEPLMLMEIRITWDIAQRFSTAMIIFAGRRSAAPPDERRWARDIQGLGSGGAQFLDERNCHTQRQTLVAGAWGR